MKSCVQTFLDHLEEKIYKSKSIYRSIIISNECDLLKTKLELRDHSVMIVNDLNNNIDYDNIDNRIVLLTPDLFKSFIEYIDANGGILNSSYNFIGFSYTIPDRISEELITFYLQKTKNNSNNTIILDKNIMHFIKFERELNDAIK